MLNVGLRYHFDSVLMGLDS